MRFLFKWLKRLSLTALLLVALLASPILWVETACRGSGVPGTYESIIADTQWQRAESRSFMTYPEWHIVHAYDDYARVISDADPHDYGFISGIRGFWSSLCALSKTSAQHGGFTNQSKQTIYTIGISFTAELAMKALYEETVGRLATAIRGQSRSPLDELSARQAAEYAQFLQQVPWYRWDFSADKAALKSASTGGFRDRERSIALGLEYGAKAQYARAIAAAVASVGADNLRLRMIVTGLPGSVLEQTENVTVIAVRPEGIEIETPRYRELTHVLDVWAKLGGEFVEIAGNDDILITAISDAPNTGALHSFKRQGYGDYRHLISTKVPDLAGVLRGFSGGSIRLEHIHDY